MAGGFAGEVSATHPTGLSARPRVPRRRDAWRPWLYPLILLTASGTLAALERDPQHEVDGVAEVALQADDGLFFRHEAAALGMLPGHGWTLTVYVKDTRRFAPASFLVVTRLGERLRGELILDEVGPGGELCSEPLEGAGLDRYLNRSLLDLRSIERTFQARYAVARPYVAPAVEEPGTSGE